MKDAYARHFEACLLDAMKQACPQFTWMDAAARRKAGGLSWYGPGKLTGFSWQPAPPLLFVIVFRSPNGADQFEASCEWSESGKLVKEQPYILEAPYSESALRQPFGRTLLQSLSQAAGDAPPSRVASWHFWQPSADILDTEQWFHQAIEDERRDLGDDEARLRVEAAVARAVADVRRLALPWCESKLAVFTKEAGAAMAAPAGTA